MQSFRDTSFSDSCHRLFVIVNHVHLDLIDPAYNQYLIPALQVEFDAKGNTRNIGDFGNYHAFVVAKWRPCYTVPYCPF